jgi:hypothetical protein
MNSFSDLKSFSNSAGRPVSRAVDFAIANQKHYLPVVVYGQGIEAVKKQVRETAAGAWLYGMDQGDSAPNWKPIVREEEMFAKWVWPWAHQPEPEALFVYQQTGSPVTRGRFMTKGSTYRINEINVERLKRKWVDCALAFGTDPWIDSAPIAYVEDHAMPQSSIDFGEE